MSRPTEYLEGGNYPSRYRDRQGGSGASERSLPKRPALNPRTGSGSSTKVDRWPQRMRVVVLEERFKNGYSFLQTENRKRVYLAINVFRRTHNPQNNRIAPGYIIDCDVDLNGRGFFVSKVYSITTPIE